MTARAAALDTLLRGIRGHAHARWWATRPRGGADCGPDAVGAGGRGAARRRGPGHCVAADHDDAAPTGNGDASESSETRVIRAPLAAVRGYLGAFEVDVQATGRHDRWRRPS